MQKKKDTVNFYVSFFILLFLGYCLWCVVLYLNVFVSAAKITELGPDELLRVKIYGSSQTQTEKTVSATFAIIDSAGNEIAAIERSWAGSYLSVDFNILTVCGKQFVFPERIEGRSNILMNGRFPAKKSTKLDRYYNENGQCLLLGFGSTLRNRERLYAISKMANNRLPIINLWLKKTVTVDLSNCVDGKYYSITKSGSGIKIQEL